ncbi:FOG: Transposon-encoded proteins with TYA, reverse transcriptase, integrase domains in various combinations [Plasmopara halstedii]|uniref:FOG: Transposon-encoded proteins with TYA, reverse transcriptase, integrase domains in various combinations n=1 Tax=Plasmopara halstedii TaxID=4781 RepID=A0A0P1ACL1_PLAHL|nr:FOG: Transposon-encoded proteins with TYA, reverse transcriptase, integrase domains in various combinations [Plasmopara halstedii]CEG38640.1 FOG: Transposon-encoded proteins with TYA, reverse transcriptase, integrase domains in various combinations [Plasmopara halstedii]|eukprot:XP_024575009.1 FOG: Transposon-encoded proteins with TYA, reverse transcriptase, integrase domains in various combinations [Plasmopara halstedii]
MGYDFDEFRPLDKPIAISAVSGGKVLVAGIETIRVILKNKKPTRIQNVLYVPDLDRRLLSIPALSGKVFHETFGKALCKIKNDNEVATRLTQKGKLFVLKCNPVESANTSEEVGQDTKPVDPSVWHARWGHLPLKTMKTQDGCINGFKMKESIVIKDDEGYDICKGCVNGESSVKPFPKSSYGEVKTTLVLQLVHIDVMTPMVISLKVEQGSS